TPARINALSTSSQRLGSRPLSSAARATLTSSPGDMASRNSWSLSRPASVLTARSMAGAPSAMAEETASHVPRAIRLCPMFFAFRTSVTATRRHAVCKNYISLLSRWAAQAAGSLLAFAPQRLADGLDEDIGVAHLLRHHDDGGERLLFEECHIAQFCDDDFGPQRGHHFERFRQRFDRGDGEIQLRENRLARGAAAWFFVRHHDDERRGPGSVGRAAASAGAASAIGELAPFDVVAHGVDTTPAELASLSAEHRHCA